MISTIIDGKAVANQLKLTTAERIACYGKHQFGLAVVLVGADPASEVYVRSKAQQTREVGMASFEHRLPPQTTHGELLALIERLNGDDAVDGILVQLPLPAQIDADAVLRAIDPAKDVDGFHPINVGRVAIGSGGIVPCTPLGSMMLIKSVQSDIAGAHAVVVGRSNIVGKPMAQLLLQEHCTVTVCHSRSRDLPELIGKADILIAAVGRPAMVRGAWIKPGAIVIDVGINRVPQQSGGSRLIGDVAFGEAVERAGALTPVPGGVGPMTIACLLHNTVEAAVARRGL